MGIHAIEKLYNSNLMLAIKTIHGFGVEQEGYLRGDFPNSIQIGSNSFDRSALELIEAAAPPSEKEKLSKVFKKHKDALDLVDENTNMFSDFVTRLVGYINTGDYQNELPNITEPLHVIEINVPANEDDKRVNPSFYDPARGDRVAARLNEKGDRFAEIRIKRKYGDELIAFASVAFPESKRDMYERAVLHVLSDFATEAMEQAQNLMNKFMPKDPPHDTPHP